MRKPKLYKQGEDTYRITLPDGREFDTSKLSDTQYVIALTIGVTEMLRIGSLEYKKIKWGAS